MVSTEISAKIAQYLLECEAVKLNVENPFTWTSGMRSPVYCDNRVTLSFPIIRKYITESLSAVIRTEYPEAQAIVGVATAGIPQGALIADELNLPFAYVRSEAKKHGLKNAIEGRLESGAKVVVVEDLISTGKSSLKAVEDLRESGIEVIGLVSIFNYGFEATKNKFAEAHCPYVSLCDFNTLANEAVKINYISGEAQAKISAWSLDAEAWSNQWQ
ncbi:MAG: orotate phosphoribosyltransferase [Bacteroidia bacterium]|nr:orotate phosphoribosyltransferase [Bacteroidia bacterium]